MSTPVEIMMAQMHSLWLLKRGPPSNMNFVRNETIDAEIGGNTGSN